MEEKLRSGTIKIYRPSWGFIDQDRGPDLYFRRSDVEGVHAPKPGQRVNYLTQRTPKGLRAVKIKILNASEATAENWHEFIHIKPTPRKAEDETAPLDGPG